jgi:hypothetical protein
MIHACPAGADRPLTPGEVALVAGVFGSAIDPAPVRIRRRKWFPLQPRSVTMAPMGHLHFHPASEAYCDDFAAASVDLQGLFIHEMVHVWQTQTKGRFYLPLRRHLFCRYGYRIRAGWRLERYGIEQQAEIVRHAFLARIGFLAPGSPDAKVLEAILTFG